VGTPASLLRRRSGRGRPRQATQASLLHSTRILIIADTRLHREALARLLASRRVGLVSTTPASEALARAFQDEPHVALLDVTLEVGLTLVGQLRATASGPKSVVIGVSENEAEVVAWAEAGVAGYVTMDDSLDDLIATIASVVCGEMLCSPRISAALLSRVQALAYSGAAISLGTLTARETEVVNLLAEGLSNKEIALCLSIALPTVKSHVHSILEKLGVRRRGEAVARLRCVDPVDPDRATKSGESR
jgi:two-component system, NarL family, nitrate/nitrite response regulator NarL